MSRKYKVVMGPAPYVCNRNIFKWIFGPGASDVSANLQNILSEHTADGWELDSITEHDATVSLFWFLPRTYTFRILIFVK